MAKIQTVSSLSIQPKLVEVSRETLITRHFPDVERVHAYAKFLETAGIERGLIGPREADRIWERHIFNCLPITTLFTEGATVFDIGSGAGLARNCYRPGPPRSKSDPD